MKDSGPKIEVRNINVPGWHGKVDAAKYEAMKNALLRTLPREEPGLTQTEMRNKVVFHLPGGLFEDDGKVAWWAKCVQLDLEFKGIIERSRTAKPLRWHRA